MSNHDNEKYWSRLLKSQKHNKDLYSQYLLSNTWKNKRKIIINRSNNICEECGLNSIYQIHHLTYTNIGDERPEDLIGLCNICHKKKHIKYIYAVMIISEIGMEYGIKTKNIDMIRIFNQYSRALTYSKNIALDKYEKCEIHKYTLDIERPLIKGKRKKHKSKNKI